MEIETSLFMLNRPLSIDTKKAAGNNTIPLKRVKLAAGYLISPLTKAINTSINKGIFPDKTTVAFVVPLDKGKSNKNEFSNF